MEPRIQTGAIERRTFPISELRVDEDADWPITGYAAVFNSLSGDLGGFQERIHPGFFRDVLEQSDVRALINHDPNLILGRNRAGTLRLWEDEHGLGNAIRPPDTQYARDLRVSMQRGDVDAMSFSFIALNDVWGTENGVTVRDLITCKSLFDVSIVTYPAYQATSAAFRSLLLGLDWSACADRSVLAAIAGGANMPAEQLTESITRARSGQASPDDRARIEQMIHYLRGIMPADLAQEGGAAAGTQGACETSQAQVRRSLLQRWLDIARNQ